MAAHCTDENCPTCIAARVKRCEVRNGRRYEDGVDVGPAQPEQGRHRNYAHKGGVAAGRKRTR